MGIQYNDKIMQIPNKQISFENLKDSIKNHFPALWNQSITIKMDSSEKSISTEYRWKKQIIKDQTLFIAKEQIGNSIQEDPDFSLKISQCMFKILNFEQKIIGLGIKISPDLCIFPKIIMKNEHFGEFSISSTIEFFNDIKGAFKSDGIFIDLGENLRSGFCISEIEGDCNIYRWKRNRTNSITSGKLICFRKKTEMLEAINVLRIEIIDNQDTFYLNIKLNEIKPISGGVISSNQGEILGLLVAGNGYYCVPYCLIMNKLSKLFEENKDNRILREKLLKINGLRIKLPFIPAGNFSDVGINNCDLQIRNYFDVLHINRK